jgi:hypothetical protein
MAILDRFRAQPRQKHPDPAVRLAFVHEIPVDERDLLAEVARDDEDPRVRRAAVAKLMSPPALASIAAGDQDEGVRSQATAMLRDIALDAFEGLAEADTLAAVDALTDSRALVVVAKTAPSETAAQRAASRVADAHGLGSIARHAAHESVRLLAFDRLQDRQEILNVALNSEFKDPALAAVDRFADRAELEQIAVRAKNKSAAKRARSLVRAIEERAAQEAAATAAAAAAATLEPPAADPIAIEAEAHARADREAADERARAAEAERRRAEEEETARVRAEQEIAERARREEQEEAARKDAERRNARLAELIVDAEAAAVDESIDGARRRIGIVRREWTETSTGIAIDPDLAARFAAAEARVADRDAALQEEDKRMRREALERLQHLAARVEALATRPELSLKAGERALRDLRTALAAIPPLPSRRDYEEIVHRLKAAQSAMMPKVQELRDVADWQRWANVGIQEQLCEKMEALKTLEDPEAIARQVRELQQQWRQAADVPRAQGEALWRRFKAAHDEVWSRCESYFAAQSAVKGENLAKKVALAERAEALADSTAWIQTADEIKKLQAEWKTIGPVTHGQERAVWERFRSACDRFFTRRHADLSERKAVWAQNLAKKEALCARAEALAESTDWENAASEIKRLQAEWKTIGPVKKTRAEAIWQRFRAACDKFFARYAQRHDIARGERVAAREAIVQELEAIGGLSPERNETASAAQAGELGETPVHATPSADQPPEGLLETVRDIRRRWQHELALRGVDRERAAALDARFTAAFNGTIARYPSVFANTDLDPDANRRRMEALVRRMEDLATSIAGPPIAATGDAALSPTTRLAAMLKEALASNTIGGKVEDESRYRAANEEVHQAQATWSRIGFVPDDQRRALADRMQRAVRRISEKTAQAGGAGQAGRPGGAAGQMGSAAPGGRPKGTGGPRR